MELVLLAIGVGLCVGVVVGALGAGGGILAVPVLVFGLGMPAHSATASSLIIVLITALASLPHHARNRNVDWRNGLVFAGVSVVGAVLGSVASVEDATENAVGPVGDVGATGGGGVWSELLFQLGATHSATTITATVASTTPATPRMAARDRRGEATSADVSAGCAGSQPGTSASSPA